MNWHVIVNNMFAVITNYNLVPSIEGFCASNGSTGSRQEVYLLLCARFERWLRAKSVWVKSLAWNSWSVSWLRSERGRRFSNKPATREVLYSFEVLWNIACIAVPKSIVDQQKRYSVIALDDKDYPQKLEAAFQNCSKGWHSQRTLAKRKVVPFRMDTSSALRDNPLLAPDSSVRRSSRSASTRLHPSGRPTVSASTRRPERWETGSFSRSS